MKNIKLVIEYDGTNYHGWQSQINAVAIQDILKNAVKKLTGEDCNIIGAGRTDTGAHALGQVANFVTSSNIPGDRFSYALNSVLPDDIVIIKSKEVSMDFHSRYSATGKKYKYLIYNSLHPSALLRNRAFHVAQPMDIDSMKKACGVFVGAHDFSAFRAAGSSAKSSERVVIISSLSEPEGKCGLIEFETVANGFLYNMVRIMIGTLIEVGIGKRPPEDILRVIESRDRSNAGKTAPAHGLYLVEVYYNTEKMI